MKANALVPTLELWLGGKFYLSASPIFVNSSGTPFSYAGTSLAGGYQKAGDKWLTDINVTIPIYNPNITLPQSVIKAQSAITLTNLNKIIDVTGGVELRLSDKLDVGTTLGLSHLFSVPAGEVSRLMINPGAYLYGGTQKFSKSVTKKRVGVIDIPGLEQTESKSVNQFKILAYEASCPLLFNYNKVWLIAIPSYIMPENLLTVTGHPELSETGKETFYMSLGIKGELIIFFGALNFFNHSPS